MLRRIRLPARAASEELCKTAAQSLKGSFTHAWRQYDLDIHTRMSEAINGFVNEVVAQTIWGVPGTLNTKLTRGELYKLAVSDEENARRQRMKFGPGGSENLRWFPANYARAYQKLSEAAEIYAELDVSSDPSETRCSNFSTLLACALERQVRNFSAKIVTWGVSSIIPR